MKTHDLATQDASLSELARKAKDDALEAVEPMKEQAAELAEQQKKSSATRLQSLAEAVHGAADQVGKEQPKAAEVIHKGAIQIEKASRALKDNTLEDLARMANKAAHDRPIAFIVGSMAAGFAISRFLRATAEQP